jgi:hypothetical protein
MKKLFIITGMSLLVFTAHSESDTVKKDSLEKQKLESKINKELDTATAIISVADPAIAPEVITTENVVKAVGGIGILASIILFFKRRREMFK